MSDANSEAAAAPAKGGSKLLVILFSILFAAVAAGGGVYYFVGGGKAADSTQDGADGERQAKQAPAIYVKFDPPFVVNFESSGLVRFLQISIEIMTRDPATAELIAQHDPRLRNDLLLLLGNQTYDKISTREGKEQLQQEARNEVAKIIVSEGGVAKNVEQLYFTSFVMQ